MHTHICGVTHVPRAPLEAMVEGAPQAGDEEQHDLPLQVQQQHQHGADGRLPWRLQAQRWVLQAGGQQRLYRQVGHRSDRETVDRHFKGMQAVECG